MDELAKKGELQSSPQNEANVTYAEKVTKEESKINWHDPALVIARKVRAFNSFPVAQTEYREAVCKIWHAEVAIDTNEDANIGEIIKLDEFIHVKCGEGILSIKELQMPGEKDLKPKNSFWGIDLYWETSLSRKYFASISTYCSRLCVRSYKGT